MAKCVVCGRERTDLIDDQCADCTMDDFWEGMGKPRKFAPRGQGDILSSLAGGTLQPDTFDVVEPTLGDEMGSAHADGYRSSDQEDDE